MPRIACYGVGEPRCDQGSSWDNKVTAKAVGIWKIETRFPRPGLVPGAGSVQLCLASWAESEDGAWLVAQVGRVNVQGSVMMS